MTLQQQNAKLYNALAKMWLWQASEVQELMPDELREEVKALLGQNMADEIVRSKEGDTFESILARAERMKS